MHFPRILVGITVLVFLLGCDKIKEATDSAQTGKSGTPAQPEDDFSKGLSLVQQLNYKEALIVLKKAMEDKPDDTREPEAMYYVAICYQNLDDKENAIKAYTAFIKKYPKHEKTPSAKKNLANKFGVAL